MSNWRNTLKWQMIEPEADPAGYTNQFREDVKKVLFETNRDFPRNRFNEFYALFLMEDGAHKLYLPTIIYYLRQGYDWFVKGVAEEIYDNYESESFTG